MAGSDTLPNYEVVPLRSETILVAALQMSAGLVDAKNPKPRIKENVERILWLLDCAHRYGDVDLAITPELALQGLDARWTREEYLRIAIEVPGEETELIGKKAKEHNCYIVVSGYTREKDWPEHYFNSAFIVAPTGEVIHRHWAAVALGTLARGVPGELATTVQDVLDEFVERYGWDAVWPVARTDIGNIATYIGPEGCIPETARAFAFKGAEILPYCNCGGSKVHTAGPGLGDLRIANRTNCSCNDVYGIYANMARTPMWGLPEDRGSGFSQIADPYGRILAQSNSADETIVTERIPIALFRQRHSIPIIRKELYAAAYNQYRAKYPANLFSEYRPKDGADAARYIAPKLLW